MKEKTAFLKDIKLDKKKTQEVVSVVLLVLLISISYISILIKPTLTGLYSVIPEVKNLKTNIKNARDEIKEESALKQKLAELEEALKNVKTRLPAEKEIPALLESLSSMARNSDMKIIGITPWGAGMQPRLKTPSAVPLGTYQEIPIQINARSGYHELGKFINNLENLDRFMEVSDIVIKSDKGSPKRHEVELKISTYILKNI